MAIAGYRQLINRDLPIEERGCTSKARFLSRAEARSITRHGRRSAADGGLRPYRCRFCEWWHLGHRRQRSHALRRPALGRETTRAPAEAGALASGEWED